MRRHDHWGKILTAAVLCPVLALSTAACGQKDSSAGGSTAGMISEETASADAAQEIEEVVFHPPVDTPSVIPGEKEETVYVKADASGTPTEKNVEVVLRKIEGTDPIEDRSDLRDIKNTEGDEEYCEAGEGRYLWENSGEEIHYKGVSDADLPVDVHITYYLEGQEVTAEQIAGKTGAVRIRFDYENNTDVPFMALSSVILPSDVFSDVDATNGKVIDIGEQKAVIGYAFPGLENELSLADYEPTEEIELPEYVEIEARAEKFELDFTATVISTGLFEEVEEEDLSDLEEMSDDMDELTDASSEMKDAAEELAEGGSEFGDYLSQYFDGLTAISEGSDALDRGLAALSSNISKLSSGSEQVQKGLEQLDSSLSGIDLSSLSSEEGEKAAKAAEEALKAIGEGSAGLRELLAAASENLSTVEEFAQEVRNYRDKTEKLREAVYACDDLSLGEMSEGLVSMLQEKVVDEAETQAHEAALEAARGALEETAGQIASASAEDARESAGDAIYESSALDGLGLTDEQIAEVKEQLVAEIRESISETTPETDSFSFEAAQIDPDLEGAVSLLLSTIEEKVSEKFGLVTAAADEIPELEIPETEVLSEEQLEAMDSILDGMEQSLGVITAYSKGIASSSESIKTAAASIGQLRSGVSSLAAGSSALTEGIGTFSTALEKAAEGSAQLSEALAQVSGAGGTLGSAYWQLVDGMNAFADGVAEFDEEGIQSLAELTGPEYLAVIRGVRAARDAERSYTNFSGICDGQKGSVKFIIETKEISPQH